METIRIETRMYGEDGLMEKIKLAVRHDYLLYPSQIKEESIYEWIRYLVNRRLTEVIKGIR